MGYKIEWCIFGGPYIRRERRINRIVWYFIIVVLDLLTYNPGQNIWNKIEKSSKTGQGKKSLISTFACFLTATAKV